MDWQRKYHGNIECEAHECVDQISGQKIRKKNRDFSNKSMMYHDYYFFLKKPLLIDPAAEMHPIEIEQPRFYLYFLKSFEINSLCAGLTTIKLLE